MYKDAWNNQKWIKYKISEKIKKKKLFFGRLIAVEKFFASNYLKVYLSILTLVV